MTYDGSELKIYHDANLVGAKVVGLVRYGYFKDNKHDKFVGQVAQKAGLEPLYRDLLNK